MSHKIAKTARKILKSMPTLVSHADMLVPSNHRVKTFKSMTGEVVFTYETFTLSHAKGSYRQVYKALKGKRALG